MGYNYNPWRNPFPPNSAPSPLSPLPNRTPPPPPPHPLNPTHPPTPSTHPFPVSFRISVCRAWRITETRSAAGFKGAAARSARPKTPGRAWQRRRRRRRLRRGRAGGVGKKKNTGAGVRLGRAKGAWVDKLVLVNMVPKPSNYWQNMGVHARCFGL